MDVTILVPMLNEERYIERCLRSIVDGLTGKFEAEILVVDGGSSDASLRLVERVIEESRVPIRIIHNPKRWQVAGLNLGLHEARGRYIVRCDSHAEYPYEYVDNLVSRLIESSPEVGNVGVPHRTVPGGFTPMAKAIAEAMAHPLAVGSTHRTASGGKEQDVATLLFGAWRRETFDTVGLFDERFVRGQDYEHNLRLRRRGFRVRLVRGETFLFYTRETLWKVIKMIFQYAAAKVEIASRYGIFSYKPLLPLILVVYLLVLPFGGIWFQLPMAGYICLVASFAVHGAVRHRATYPLLLAFIIPVMHISHGLGTLFSTTRFLIGARQPIHWGVTR